MLTISQCGKLTAGGSAGNVGFPIPAPGSCAIWPATGGFVITNNNLTVRCSSGGVNNIKANIGKSSGKWYWEARCDAQAVAFGMGVCLASFPGYYIISQYAGSWGSWGYGVGFPWQANVLPAPAIGQIRGYALDMDAGILRFYVNGVLKATLVNITGTVYPCFCGSLYSDTITANFGQSAFIYPVPDGYHPGVY